jgi:hypothetical protein
MAPATARPTTDPALAAVKTYRYLRLALVALVLLLFAAIALEWWAAGRACLQPSISAYYYTPVRAVLVGVLVTMGVCLIALKGSSEPEDVLLNFAGMLAPGVAFVPTPDLGECRSVPLVPREVSANVANNMQALFVVGLLVAGVVVVIARSDAPGDRLGRWARIGIGVTAAVLLGGALWFYLDRESFLELAHGVAAVPMFLALVAVVWLNARHVRESVGEGSMPVRQSRYVPVYRGIAVGMLVALVLVVGLSLLTGSTSLVFWVEVLLITLFAAFWVVQTVELWSRGLRPDTT